MCKPLEALRGAVGGAGFAELLLIQALHTSQTELAAVEAALAVQSLNPAPPKLVGFFLPKLCADLATKRFVTRITPVDILKPRGFSLHS